VQDGHRAPLGDLLGDLLGGDGRLIVVSNRGPLTFIRDGEGAPLTALRGPGGLVTALGELGRHAPVTWVAATMTDADREVAPILRRMSVGGRGAGGGAADGDRRAAKVARLIDEQLPGQDLRLVYVPFDPETFEKHYGIVSNPFLWFVHHEMYASAYGPNVDDTLLDAWRNGYRPVNLALADAAVEAAGPDPRPVILLQDYHLYLAAPRIRERLPGATILHFNHVPWPADSHWQLLPQSLRRAICEGLLACDIVGLQTDRYAGHFLDSVASFVRDARVDRSGRNVAWRGRRIRVRTYPISVDPAGLARFAASDAVEQPLARVRERLERAGNPRLIVRADRIEPSKNALRGYLAFESLLDRRPDLRETVRFVAVQATTRSELPEYAEYATAVREVIARINGMADPDDQPIWLYDGTDYAMAIAALRIADVVLVNPLVDGMNLVAKEAALVGQHDPVLVLSETAGAAEQLASDALSVAPADIVGTATALERALDMPQAERRYHLRRMRGSVRQEDLRWWLSRQLRDLAAVRVGALPPSRRLRDTVRRVDSEVV
jgi:trehalose 6-phosphate synthase